MQMQEMPFVKEADIAFRIGESQVNRSYLVSGQYTGSCKEREGVDGIHPGYGLLSENADSRSG